MSERKIAIYGAGGFGREVSVMLERCNPVSTFVGFLDDDAEKLSRVRVAEDFDDVAIAIANTNSRKKIFHQWSLPAVPFHPIVAADVFLHPSIAVGIGAIVCSGTKLTLDITIGRFVIINLNATVGHDVRLGDFCSIMPGVNISGNVTIESDVFIGSGATILQGIHIGQGSIVGAGAVVTRDLPPYSVAVGVPARIIKKAKND
ncbi:MAG TPA: acetyltransferase [Chryseosolibacter sp.]